MERGITADQVMAALWRRRTLVGGIALGLFLVAAVMVMTLPNVYRATSVVHMNSQALSPELVQRTVNETPDQRLITARQELLGRPVLEKVITELKLYPGIVSKKGMDAAAEQMRLDLEVKPAGETGFELTYSAGDRVLAAKVANRIPEVFAEANTKTRIAQAGRATSLFNEEMTTLKASVTHWEKQIAQFKVDHNGELPEQMEVNMRGLERTATLTNARSEDMRAAETRRSDIARSHYTGDTEAGRLKASEDALTQQLVTARTTWTEDHPDVKRMANELKGLVQKRKAAEEGMVADRQEKTRATTMVGSIQNEILGLQKQAETYQKRLESTPRWAEELGVLQRDYEITKTKYQSVVGRKVEAEIAQEMEAKSASSMFEVVSPAGVPSAAAKPDRLSALLVSLLVSIAAGVLVGVFLELRDDTIHNSDELKNYLPIPVLAVVPMLSQKLNAEKRVLMPVSQSGVTPPSPSTLN